MENWIDAYCALWIFSTTSIQTKGESSHICIFTGIVRDVHSISRSETRQRHHNENHIIAPFKAKQVSERESEWANTGACVNVIVFIFFVLMFLSLKSNSRRHIIVKCAVVLSLLHNVLSMVKVCFHWTTALQNEQNSKKNHPRLFFRPLFFLYTMNLCAIYSALET